MAQQVRSDDPVRKRRHLSPETKFQIFLEASRGDIPVVEVLRKWGIHSSDVKRIRETVRAGALKEFQTRKSRVPLVSAETVEQLRQEKTRLEQTLIEQSVELMLLKKKLNGDSRAPSWGTGCLPTGNGRS
jgi:transposase-like protein